MPHRSSLAHSPWRLRLAAGLLVGLAMLASPLAARAESVSVNVQDDGRGVYTAHGYFTVDADGPAAWRVLTDYGDLGRFIPSVHSSVVRRSSPTQALVSQESITYFLSFPKHIRVLLQVQEDPMSRIDFTDVAQEDFDFFKGAWSIEKTSEGVKVGYEALAKPKINLPLWGKSLFASTVQSQLFNLRKEIMRREAGSSN